MVAAVRNTSQFPNREPSDLEKKQLHNDRVAAVVIMVVIVAVAALIVWLSSLGAMNNGVDPPIWIMP